MNCKSLCLKAKMHTVHVMWSQHGGQNDGTPSLWSHMSYSLHVNQFKCICFYFVSTLKQLMVVLNDDLCFVQWIMPFTLMLVFIPNLIVAYVVAVSSGLSVAASLLLPWWVFQNDYCITHKNRIHIQYLEL